MTIYYLYVTIEIDLKHLPIYLLTYYMKYKYYFYKCKILNDFFIGKYIYVK